MVAGLSTVVSGFVLNRAIGRQITGEIAADLRHQALLARDLLRGEAGIESAADRLADRIGDDLKRRVTVVAADGRVLGDTELDGELLANVENHASRPEIRAAAGGAVGMSQRYSTTLQTDMVYVAFRSDHPVVKEHPELFSDSPTWAMSPRGMVEVVEQATAAPGEKRRTRR